MLEKYTEVRSTYSSSAITETVWLVGGPLSPWLPRPARLQTASK